MHRILTGYAIGETKAATRILQRRSSRGEEAAPREERRDKGGVRVE
jgi:hypothetical protein